MVKIRETAPLDVARDALELCATQVALVVGDEIDVPDDLDDSAMDGALFDLYCAVRLARAAEARIRLLSMMVAEAPKKAKRKKGAA